MAVKSQDTIRVRIAPSPTGALHVGTARAALFNWLFARKNSGTFILRIEDTDKERSKKEYEESIISGLEWLGLEYGEFYRQSERTEIYQMYIKKLLESGSAFYCYHTKEDLEKEKKEQVARKEAMRHICSKMRNDGNRIIRFKNPGGKIKFHDLIRNEIEFNGELLGDFSIAKDEKTPLYNLAAVIDDHEMKISNVIRGEDHISNTPKQLLIFQALGVESPQYAHLPMILGTDKSKLSKRHGATSLLEYRDQGYLPDAMLNFLALVGWSPQHKTRSMENGTREEIMSREEIIQKFEMAAVQKSGAVFNIEKLDWINGEYIRQLPIEKLAELSIPYLKKSYNLQLTTYNLQKIIALEQPRMKKLSEIGESTRFFFDDIIEYDGELLRWKKMTDEEIKEVLAQLMELLSGIPDGDYLKETLEEIIVPKAEQWGNKIGKIDRGRTLWPLRVALTGRRASPGPFEVAEILGKKKCLQRLAEARTKL